MAFPLGGVVLVFGCGSTAKIERVVFWGSDLQLCVEGNHMHREISPLAPSFRRCWIMARMGATPVPGPTHMIGVLGSSGRVTNPFEIPTRMVSPFGGVSESKAPPRGGGVKPKLTRDQGRQVRCADTFPWHSQASSIVYHCNAKVYFLREVLAFS